ncbi:MAG: FRG domain-containing protein [Planctomycetota bacterium]|nr:FRG domain-containing protein [Planctomycetota bacterium]
MQPVEVTSWSKLRDVLYRFAQLPRDQRDLWWFRGQSRFGHELTPSLDRDQEFTSDSDRERRISQLLIDYRREAIDAGLGADLPTGDAFELLARHHGLPSPLLDWTRSPYVAACFAFAGADPRKDPHVAIYALDRSRLPARATDPLTSSGRAAIELIDDPELLPFNRRACQQRGVFMRRSTILQPLEELLQPALWKFRVPATERECALRDLDQMLLNLTTLMYDLDGAARTVAWRTA